LSGTTLPDAIALFVACLRPIARTSSICPEIVGKNSGKDAPFPLLAEVIFLATYSGSNRIFLSAIAGIATQLTRSRLFLE
jgi:hypothetical protein